MTRTRRRLLVLSAPVVLVVVLVAVKLATMVMAGNAAVQNFSRSDTAALTDDVAAMSTFNVAERAKAPFAAGALAVLEDRLPEAEREFAQALSRTDHDESCSTRVNLELVRETLGDRAAGVFEAVEAVGHYRAARQTVEDAPAECFAGNADTDPDRRAVRESALERLDAKIAAVSAPPPPPPPPPPPVAEAPAPVPGNAPEERESERLLNPGEGDPLERLGEILQDAVAP